MANLMFPPQKYGTIAWPVRYGRYRLTVTSADKRQMASNFLFNAGWYTSGKIIGQS